MNRRAMILSPIALLGAQKHNYRFDRKYGVQPRALDVEIVNGNIRVRGSRTNEVRVEAEVTLNAPTTEDLELAKREVHLEPRLDGETFRVSVDAPANRQWQRYSYRHDVTITVPVATRMLVRGINGSVEVSYESKPTRDIYVKTINGEVKMEFPGQPDADFQMRTRNGEIYCAWEMAAIPGKSEIEVTSVGMRRIVSRNRSTGGRLGRGGIEVQIESLNGDIRIVERKG